MKDTFLYTLHAILPILLVVLSGYAVRRLLPWEDDLYTRMNALCFRFFLPVQLFYNVYSIEDLSDVNWTVIGFLLVSVFFFLLTGLAAARHFIHDPRQKGVIVQASFRSNQSLLGIPLANALGGPESVPYTSLATSVCVPAFNVLAVVVLTVFSGDPQRKLSIRSLARRVTGNPLIISTVSGLILVMLRQFFSTVAGVPVFTMRAYLPSFYQALSMLANVASPLMLFILGARFDFKRVSGLLPQITLGVLLRLVICPAMVLSAALALRGPLGLTTLEMPTVIAVTSTPVAVSSAVMAREIGGDDQLAGQLVVWTSLISIVSVFCIVYLFRMLGLL